MSASPPSLGEPGSPGEPVTVKDGLRATSRIARWLAAVNPVGVLVASRTGLSALALRRLHREVRHGLEAASTDIEAARTARTFMDRYVQARADERLALLRVLAAEAARYPSAGNLSDLMDSARVRFFKRFNSLDGGLGFLVQLRADMLQQRRAVAGLETLAEDLGSLFAAWFDVGFLELREITWDSPASLLEKLMRYEAVHAFTSWEDVRNRLDQDRQCFAFFHPRLPGEPLIFVEIALLEELAADVGVILDEKAPQGDPSRARWAVFYSISNTQAGLRGVSFGNFLLKRVIEAVQAKFPKLERFATLSPIPGFAAWVRSLSERDIEAIAGSKLARALGQGEGWPASLAGSDVAQWLSDDAASVALQEQQRALGERLVAHFLARARHESEPLDPVARFHLGNGARIERVNWRADRSPKGMRESFGAMVNYRYIPADLDFNLARLKQGETQVGRAVERLL